MLGARGGRIAALGTLAALVVAVVLRWQALGTAYWFDELWSIRHALAATSLAELYARAHDNNHLLNTVAIYWVGSRDAVLAYRALPFAAGLAVLVLAIADRGLTPLQRLVRTLVLGVSPLLVLLSSEARGYAPALAAALAVWQLLRRRFGAIDGTGSWLPVAGLNLLLPLGLASHLIFVHVYVAAFLFAVYALRSRGAPAGESARELTALFALPGSLAALHAVFFVLPMETGGGPDFTVAEFATRLVAFAIGIPEWSALCAVVGLFVAVLFGQHLARLRRAGDPRWVFDSVVVLVSPLIAPLLFSPGVIAVRYFAVSILFLLIALADRGAAELAAGGLRRVGACVALVLLGLGNATHLAEFARVGRGQYREALQAMADQQAGRAEIRVAADHDSRTRLLVDFHAREIDRPIRFIGRADASANPPEWFIRHAAERGEEALAQLGVHGRSYRFIARYDFAYLSGFRWDVYRLEAGASSGVRP